MDFVHCGLVDEPELVFRAWLEQAVLIAGGVLPNRAVRFVVAPRRTPMLGVWIPSQDALGRSFPLVFLRRLSTSSDAERATGSIGLGDLPWTLLLAGCAHYLAAAESCLMLGRASSAASVWTKLEGLPLPAARDLTELCTEANRVLDSERLEAFATRNLGVGASNAEFLSALRRLGPPVRERAGDRAAGDVDSMLGVPAANEFDMFAWLELLRAQRAADATPRSLFWSPGDHRALVSLGAPLPGTLAFLRQPPVRSVQRLPIVDEPDESPAIEHELCRLVRRCMTLSKLRAALSGDRKEAGRPPPLPEKERQTTPASPSAPAAPPPREPLSDSEPPPLKKFSDVTAPRSHFPSANYPEGTADDVAREQQAPARPTHAPRTEPLSDSVQTEQSETTPDIAARRAGIRFRIPDPPINLSDTDAIEYVCTLVRERERADEERERAAQRRERIAAAEANDQSEHSERARQWRERIEAAEAAGLNELREHADGRRDGMGAAARTEPDVRGHIVGRSQPERPARESERAASTGEAVASEQEASMPDPANAQLVLEHVVERERSFSRREDALAEREREVRRRELALQARERQLRARERAVRHDERARRISQTVTIPDRAPPSVRVLEPITLVHDATHTAATARNRRRAREPVTVVDDGSIRAARVLMIE